MTPAALTTAKFTTVASMMGEWQESVLNGEPPVTWPHGLPTPELTPGHVVLLGGAPGSGKTAVAMQIVVEALRNNVALRAMYACCEMTPAALLDRQLARLSGVDAETIRLRAFTKEHGDRLDVGLATIEEVAARLAFLEPPFTLENLAASADAHAASLLVLDYVQRFSVGGPDGEGRARMNAAMDALRRFASAGHCVLVLSAVGRQRDSQGRSSYADLNLASFRESSELEFGCDSAYIIAPINDDASSAVRLACVKNRHGPMTSVDLAFDRAHQSFSLIGRAEPDAPTSRRTKNKNPKRLAECDPAFSAESLAALWGSVPAAGESDE